ncbi:MAG TPA: hypothetical protein DCG19_03295 [Cryomorphaceae bacterium]|nr:hypothetical protein [Owenweeksia sp.]MBF97555.1 hypothetical protein [Owenweeksia sp.]HAD96403.1 hypothetical protein [Cryomorphaceae bacterium]|tara:strand:+ start:10687 stop:11841 length:1155 start_codon:yes stop_codon:yes gene_type:complete
MQSFKELINPLTVREFTENIYNNKAYLIKGVPTKFDSLITWQDINDTLNTSTSKDLKSSFRMFKDRQPVNFSDTFDIVQNTQNGATLIAEDFDRTNIKLGRLHDSIESELGENTRSNLYISYPSIRGFGLHYDTHDFLIIQLYGKKRWKVYPATIEQPLFHLKSHAINDKPPEDELYLDCILEKGDVLYVPKGHWHEVIAEGNDLSVHLTLAIFVRTGIDFLNWLSNEVREIPLFRSAFPLTTASEEKSKEYLKKMASSFSQIMESQDIYDSFMQWRISKMKNRTVFNYPYHIFSNQYSEISKNDVVKSRTPIHIKKTETVTFLTAPRTLIKLPPSMNPLIDYIYSEETNVLDFEKMLQLSDDRDQIKSTIEKLFTQGLLRIPN